MNNDRAKELVDNELKKLKYVLEWENDADSKLLYTASIGLFGLFDMGMGVSIAGATGSPEINGAIIGAAISIPLSIGLVHLINYAHGYSNSDKLEMKRDHYSKKILLAYRKELKKGNNPLECVCEDYDAFQHKLNADIETKYAKQLKLK